MSLDSLKWGADGLVTVVAQDRLDGEVRMLAHADRAALEATLRTGKAHFYSRSRRTLWMKGESSGHTLTVAEIWADCDGDALVYLVEPQGPTCHTERETCFFRRIEPGAEAEQAPVARQSEDTHARPLLGLLWRQLEARQRAGGGRSYTRKLLDAGADHIGEKVEEEAEELARALRGESDARVVSEAADVVYHLMVGLLHRGLRFRDVEAELLRRFGTSGLVEKARRSTTPQE